MEFNTMMNLGNSNNNKPYQWICNKFIITHNGEKALSQFIQQNNNGSIKKILDATSTDDLIKQMNDMAKNFLNPNYVNKEIGS